MPCMRLVIPVEVGMSGILTLGSTVESPGHGKPKAKRWDYILTEEAHARHFSSLKAASQLLKNPGLISLGGGLPSCTLFPFEYLQVKVPRLLYFSESGIKDSGSLVQAGKYDAAEGRSLYDVYIPFNYGQATGSV